MKRFDSFLANQMQQYITYRRGLGYNDKNLVAQLARFDRYLCRQKVCLKQLSPMFFIEIKKAFNNNHSGFNAFLLAIRGFFDYLQRLQRLEYNPLADISAYPPRAFIPFIFSAAQVDTLLATIQAQIRKTPDFFLKDMSCYTAILLLARCGMRLREPLRLKLAHYCSKQATLYIEKTKFSKDRLIALPKTAAQELKNFYSARTTLIKSKNPYLLPGPNQNGLSCKTLYKVFQEALSAMDLDPVRRTIANTTFGNPTPHSLRHSFAINTLKKIKQRGGSPQHALPVLSAYLGHRKYRYTAVYLKVLDAEHRQRLVDFAISRQQEL